MKRLPQHMAYGFNRWQLEVDEPTRLRAVRRLSWQAATADDKALLVFGGLFWLGFSALALWALGHSLDMLGRLLRGRPASAREALLLLGFGVVWLGLLWRFWPRVWRLEADRRELRFGRRRWSRQELRALRLHWGRYEDAPLNDAPLSGGQIVRWLKVAVQEREGRWRTVWLVGGTRRARTVAAAWVRRMAQIADLPLEERRER